MKIFLSSLGTLALLLLCSRGQNLVYTGALPILNGGTNKVTALSTSAYYVVSCERASDTSVAIAAGFKYLNAPGAGDNPNLRLDIYRGIENGSFESNVWQSWVIPGNSTTPFSVVSNCNVGAIPTLRVRFANTSTNSHATNVYLSEGFRR